MVLLNCIRCVAYLAHKETYVKDIQSLILVLYEAHIERQI
jgi:hypothetical protein